jgi:hypothetical protein
LFRHAWHCFQINDLLIFQFLLVFGWKPINHSAKSNFHARRKSLQRIILKVKVETEISPGDVLSVGRSLVNAGAAAARELLL